MVTLLYTLEFSIPPIQKPVLTNPFPQMSLTVNVPEQPCLQTPLVYLPMNVQLRQLQTSQCPLLNLSALQIIHSIHKNSQNLHLSRQLINILQKMLIEINRPNLDRNLVLCKKGGANTNKKRCPMNSIMAMFHRYVRFFLISQLVLSIYY